MSKDYLSYEMDVTYLCFVSTEKKYLGVSCWKYEVFLRETKSLHRKTGLKQPYEDWLVERYIPLQILGDIKDDVLLYVLPLVFRFESLADYKRISATAVTCLMDLGGNEKHLIKCKL